MSVSDKLAGAVVGAVAAVGVLGAGWAFAQETPSTTTPPTTEAPADGVRRQPGHDCPVRDGAQDAPATEQTSV